MRRRNRGKYRRREMPNFVRRRRGRDKLVYRLLKNKRNESARPGRRRKKGDNKRDRDLRRKGGRRKRRTAGCEMKRGGNWRRRGENWRKKEKNWRRREDGRKS